jgi:hypothetical protein
MHPRSSPSRATGAKGRARGSLLRSVGLLALLAAAAAGCSGHGSPATKTRAIACGTAKTAAEVPVKVVVAKGSIACSAAKSVVLAYARAIRSGDAPGNGGGGPVKINGWTCQGFATPEVLETGKAAKCKRDGVEILEILPPPPSPSAS